MIIMSLSADFGVYKKLTTSDPITLYVMGIFTILAGAIFIRFYGKDKSETVLIAAKNFVSVGETELFTYRDIKFSLIKNRNKIGYDIPLGIQRFIIGTAVFYFSTMTIDDRTISLFFDLSEKFKPSAAEYCIEEEDEDEVKVEDIPGCKLILREIGRAHV